MIKILKESDNSTYTYYVDMPVGVDVKFRSSYDGVVGESDFRDETYDLVEECCNDLFKKITKTILSSKENILKELGASLIRVELSEIESHDDPALLRFIVELDKLVDVDNFTKVFTPLCSGWSESETDVEFSGDRLDYSYGHSFEPPSYSEETGTLSVSIEDIGEIEVDVD